jgi:hypothetical protein
MLVANPLCWFCRDAAHLLLGCDVTMTGSGSLWSPGYGTTNSYPDLMKCQWTLNAPSDDRSITVKFDDFDLEQADNITVWGNVFLLNVRSF